MNLQSWDENEHAPDAEACGDECQKGEKLPVPVIRGGAATSCDQRTDHEQRSGGATREERPHRYGPRMSWTASQTRPTTITMRTSVFTRSPYHPEGTCMFDRFSRFRANPYTPFRG